MQGKRFSRRISLIFAAALVAFVVSSPTGAQTPCPNVYCLNPVTPTYIEASEVLPLSGDDAWLGISLPFPFTFYNSSYNQAYISTNGYVSFLAGSSQYSNTCIPTAAAPNAAIYALWDDLHVDGSARMYSEVLGTAPNRQFVIEWRNVTFIAKGGRLDFEIVLHEKTGAITLQYRGIDQIGFERGDSGTIGVESDITGGTVYAFQFSCNAATIGSTAWPLTYPTDGPPQFAIQYSPPSTEPATQTVAVDIKPGACPNPFNPGSKGVLPVAILGTDKLDVRKIDPQSVTLVGLSPLHWSYEDVGTPAKANECNALGPDGHLDLTLKFDSEKVAAALGTANDGLELVLQLTGTLQSGTLRTGTLQSGSLQNGTPISGQDKVIIKKGR